jgi:hypothetical protein
LPRDPLKHERRIFSIEQWRDRRLLTPNQMFGLNRKNRFSAQTR